MKYIHREELLKKVFPLSSTIIFPIDFFTCIMASNSPPSVRDDLKDFIAFSLQFDEGVIIRNRVM